MLTSLVGHGSRFEATIKWRWTTLNHIGIAVDKFGINNKVIRLVPSLETIVEPGLAHLTHIWTRIWAKMEQVT